VRRPQTPLATSLLLSLSALLVFSALWFLGCPRWAERAGLRCDLIIGVTYFAVCPGLALLGLIFSTRDMVHRERRIEAIVAFCISAALLAWYWMRPPR
jgi:hypothetical protein